MGGGGTIFEVSRWLRGEGRRRISFFKKEKEKKAGGCIQSNTTASTAKTRNPFSLKDERDELRLFGQGGKKQVLWLKLVLPEIKSPEEGDFSQYRARHPALRDWMGEECGGGGVVSL